MKKFPIISADLFTENTGTPEQRKYLIDQILQEYQKDDQGMAFSNEGCWRSNYKYHGIEWLTERITLLVLSAIEYYKQLDPSYAKKTEFYGEPEINYWSNVNDPGSKNALHTHQLYHYVALYYLDAEGTGDLVFHNPSNLTEGCNPTAPFVGRIAWTPKNGDLLVWPAWMPHETDINLTSKPRINIAFNIRFKTPRMIYD